jgi:uncharacterized protein YjbI with pentapeptide repeats
MSDLTITFARFLVAPPAPDFGIAPFNQANISGADLTAAQGLTFDQISGATFSSTTAFYQDIGNQILGTFTGIG